LAVSGGGGSLDLEPRFITRGVWHPDLSSIHGAGCKRAMALQGLQIGNCPMELGCAAVKVVPQLLSLRAVAVSMQRSLVEGVVFAVCFHYT
jgi:hypothetical protein